MSNVRFRRAKVRTKVSKSGTATFECEEGQVELSRFTEQEQLGIAKARAKAEELHNGMYWSVYCNGYFPRKDNCHRNAQLMAAYSGLPLTYHEGWTLYRYENGDVSFCYHAWNEYPDGTVLDTTWDFDYVVLTEWKLSSKPRTTKARLTQRDFRTQQSQLKPKNLPEFLHYHSDSFINRVAEHLDKSEVLQWLDGAKSDPMFDDVPEDRWESLAENIIDSSLQHFAGTTKTKTDLMDMLQDFGVVRIQPFQSERLAIEAGAVVL